MLATWRDEGFSCPTARLNSAFLGYTIQGIIPRPILHSDAFKCFECWNPSCSIRGLTPGQEQAQAPVEVAHVAGLDCVGFGVARLADALGRQPLLVLLQLRLVCGRHKLVLVAKQVVLCGPLLQQPGSSTRQTSEVRNPDRMYYGGRSLLQPLGQR